MAEDYLEEDLSSISKILSALNSTAHDPHNYTTPLKYQVLNFDQEKNPKPGRLIFFRHKKLLPNALKQLAQKSGISENKINELVKCKVLFLGEDGRPHLNTDKKHIYSHNKALFYLIMLSTVIGFLLASVLFNPYINFQSWIMYFCIGYALGNLFGFVLQHSFKVYPLIIQLEKLKPWLKTNESFS